MNALFLSSRSALMFLFTASITACFAAAFSPTTQLKCITTKNEVVCNNKFRTTTTFPSTTMLHAAEDDNNTRNNNNIIDSSRVIENDLGLEIIRGTGLDNAEEISDQTWAEIEQSAPSKLMVLKNVSL